MMKNKDGGPAFPYVQQDPRGFTRGDTQGGMSLRDWFAGMAMQGMLASDRDMTEEEHARWAYKRADWMLRVKQEG
jgi:hypothetical protein